MTRNKKNSSREGLDLSPRYRYIARDWSGREHRGTREAKNTGELVEQLLDSGLVAVDIQEQKELFMPAARHRILFRTGSRDLMLFCRQFAVMIRAGMTALHALETLAAQVKNTALRRELETATGRLAGGHSLAGAFDKAGFFPPFFTGLLKVGEESGRLETVLEQLADHFEKQHDLEQKIRTATAYPLFVTAVALVVMGVMVLFVLPRFAAIFASMGVEMPPAAAFFLNTGRFLLKNRYLLPLFLLPPFLAAAHFKTGRGRLRLDRLRLRLPLLKSFYQQALTARFARTMSMLLASGIPLTASLELTGRVLDNRIAAHLLHRTCSAIKKGKTMAAALQGGVFPEMLIEMIRAGEKTGELEKMLQHSAAHYEREMAYLADRLGTLLEPLLLLLIGSVIGLLVYSIFSPMYQVFQMI